jgi:hypothetical protein
MGPRIDALRNPGVMPTYRELAVRHKNLRVFPALSTSHEKDADLPSGPHKLHVRKALGLPFASLSISHFQLSAPRS